VKVSKCDFALKFWRVIVVLILQKGIAIFLRLSIKAYNINM